MIYLLCISLKNVGNRFVVLFYLWVFGDDRVVLGFVIGGPAGI